MGSRGEPVGGHQPRPLDGAELDRALIELAAWGGDGRGISREVRLGREQRKSLLHGVEAVQEELDHHAVIEERADGGVVFVLRTHSLDAVTELDLQLARRIDDLIGARSEGE